MKFLAIIPARWASSRFPGKPLALLGGLPMIERVYRRAASALGAEQVAVATDDQRIYDCVTAFGGRAIMTSTAHRSGTDRCLEALQQWHPEALGANDTVVINVQGDEPFIAIEQIEALKGCFDHPATQIATLAKPFDPARGFEALFDPNRPKVVMDTDGFALYFSRSIIPYVRGAEWQQWLDKAQYFTHIGMYGYRAEVLQQVCALPQSSLELAESLEQLRWLQNGYKIRVALSQAESMGIDTPADLQAAEKYLIEHGN